ncbi:MAG: hypothetical protein Q9167_007777 [Letrouitia subvulpina]
MASKTVDDTETKEHQNPPIDFSCNHLLHDVFRIRAADPIQTPLLAFPKSSRGIADFEYFTAKDLNRFTDTAAWWYRGAGIPMAADSRTVGLVGPTNLDWVISTFGLSRMGCTIVILSPRLSHQAIVKLMKETRCECLIYYKSAPLLLVVDQVKASMSIMTIAMISREEYDGINDRSQAFSRSYKILEEKSRIACILHSSGSTGMPKPIYLPHSDFTKVYEIGPGDRDLMTLPLFHAFALRVVPGRIYQRKTVFFLNSNLPVTSEGLTVAINVAKPGTICVVPYVLKLLREHEAGIEALRSCEQVLFTGSQCPDDLGDYLVDRGINLASLMGITETGYLGASLGRPSGDKTWNYLRVPPPLMQHIWPKPVTKDTFEFVFLKDYPSRFVTNSNDPPESFYSKDIFTPHSTIPAAWKYLGRLDDRITLLNGEKVLPIPIEGTIRQAPLVKEAVVFGVGKSVPGLLLFRADPAKDLSDEDFISSVWSKVQEANASAEAFSQIGENLIVLLPAGVEIPTTDKGSVIRAQVYQLFASEIEDAYKSLDERSEGAMKMSLDEMKSYLLHLGQVILGPQVTDLEIDLFTLGLDSLKAIQMRGSIIKDIDLGGRSRQLGQNVVLEQGNLIRLAKHLNDLRSGHLFTSVKPVAAMREQISRFSISDRARPPYDSSIDPDKRTIVLTGATGGLGVHLLAQLVNTTSVKKVYCLIRGANPSSRLLKGLKDRRLETRKLDKVTILTSDLNHPQLGLEASMYTELLFHTTHIIHCAWPVNFQLPLSAFDPSLQGLQNLLLLSLDVKRSRPARFVFCSSISAALGTTPPAQIPEAPIMELDQASQTGYAQSKLIAEHIIERAVEEAGVDATILRIGQVAADTESGIWNDGEAYPLLIKSALTMGILPQLDLTCHWLPVNVLARSILQIEGFAANENKNGRSRSSTSTVNGQQQQKHDVNGFADGGGRWLRVFNLVSPRGFSWTDDLLPALSAAGLSFRPVSVETWIHRLRRLSRAGADAEEHHAADPKLNPAIKLVDFFAETFGNRREGQEEGIVFETKDAERAAPALREAESILDNGLLEKTVGVWMEKWKGEGGL